MKTDRKITAEKSPSKLRSGNGVRPSASQSNGKYAEKKRNSSVKDELRASQKRFSVAFEHAPIRIIESSPDGKHFNVNEEFCRILGFGKQELLERGMKDITHEEDYPIEVRMHQKLVAGEIPFYELEKRYVRKDGGLVWVELTRSAVRDAHGKALYTIGAVLDISERKRAERAQ